MPQTTPHDPVFLARRYEAHALLSEHHTATLFGQHAYAEALREAYWLRASGQERFWWATVHARRDALVITAARNYTKRELDTITNENVGTQHLYMLWARALKLRKEEDRGANQNDQTRVLGQPRDR